jgi:signal transduction histidine kinase
MFDLRPSMLASMGLTATLCRYVEDYQQAFKIAVTLTVPHQGSPIDDAAQIVIFRVVQESLQNVHKHAQATAVHIDLAHLDDASLRLQISDNGQGFDPQRVRPTSRSGVGLLGMEERAALLGGTLAIESSLGRGTTVTLHLPPRTDQGRAGDQVDASPQFASSTLVE